MSDTIHDITSLPKKTLLNKKTAIIAGAAIAGVTALVAAVKFGLVSSEDTNVNYEDASN